VLFAVPGAFTPSCSARHLPPYIENLPAIKDKGVDVVAVLAFNDAWVMSAWGKANGVKGDDIVSAVRIQNEGIGRSRSPPWLICVVRSSS
jgi:peroxiredoxin